MELFASALITLAALLIITVVRFGWADGLVAAGLFVLSLFAHEAGHILTARITHTEISAIGASWKGVYLRRKRAAGITEFLISAAGPAVNIALAALLWNGTGIAVWAAELNAALAVINLLPFSGSDGHRILNLLTHAPIVNSEQVPTGQ